MTPFLKALKYKGSHVCPVAALKMEIVGKRVIEWLDEVDPDGKHVGEFDELFSRMSQYYYDAGHAAGVEHANGKSEASLQERADAVERRASENGFVKGWKPDRRSLEHDDQDYDDGGSAGGWDKRTTDAILRQQPVNDNEKDEQVPLASVS